ncbi:MAG: hypothetical protein HY023_09630 [Chloroflexi bacterium]|nr:hypothetical protein [Chloroflexota bacterium]
MKIKKKPHRRSRPRSVTILAWLAVLYALGTLGYGLVLVLASGAILGVNASTLSDVELGELVAAFGLGIVQLIFALPLVWIGFGLFRLRPWAWLAAMALQGFYLLVGLIDYLKGHPDYISMLVSIVIVLYLNTEEVRDAFRQGLSGNALTLGGESEQ